MNFYFAMVNAWSLAWEALNGTMDDTYPIREDVPESLWGKEIPDIKITSRESDEYDIINTNPGAGNTAYTEPLLEDDGISPLLEDDGLDYEVKYYDDYMADIDDQRAHHFNYYGTEKMDYEPQRNHQYKYHEKEILKDIEEYVSNTYNGHYTGTKHEFRKVQTIDLMAARDIAAQFCQANILKYGSRYGSKDGRNKKDLLKVIHYAMLLLHFDGHYGKPSVPTDDFDQMP